MNKIPLNRINPLRYPGGKRWFAPYLDRMIGNNGMNPNLFVEPFAGGAGAALYLLHTNKVEAIGLSDKDPLLSSFWKTVFYDTDWLLNEIENTPITIDQWHFYKNASFSTTRERAFQCLFLNRTNFSGILAKNVGPIGGVSQASNYKIDCRFNKSRIISIIKFLSDNYSDRVLFVWNKSWKYTIGELSRRIEKGQLDKRKILIYLDPPFIHQGKALYRHYFQMKNHIDLRNTLAKCDLPWILSYDDCDESRKLYRGLPHSTLDVLYCSSTYSKNSDTKAKSELIVSNLRYTLSEILPSSKNKKRITANTSTGSSLIEKQDSICQSNIQISRTGTR
jgi:DNA adenine methylase